MLTTEVVKGLLAGKTYQREGIIKGNLVRIRLDVDRLFASSTTSSKWEPFAFSWFEMSQNWNEVVEWQEIDWKEAVDCHNEGIPLQRYRLGEWIDVQNELNLETLGFICNSKWRKKVEVNND